MPHITLGRNNVSRIIKRLSIDDRILNQGLDTFAVIFGVIMHRAAKRVRFDNVDLTNSVNLIGPGNFAGFGVELPGSDLGDPANLRDRAVRAYKLLGF